MICAWKQLLAVLPPEMRRQVEGKQRIQELRLRLGAPLELVMGTESQWLMENIRQEDLNYVINAATRYSPWCGGTMAQGYLTISGGHRIGIGGSAVPDREGARGFESVRSLCIRVARDIPGVADRIPLSGSILILGAPGWGKTTLLRDLTRKIAEEAAVCVVDERRELFPEGIPRGKRMDVLEGFPKPRGMEMALRTMGPAYIAVDEITAEADCTALIQAANCGVHLLATVHASDLEDLRRRERYRVMLNSGVFRTLVLLRKDKSYCVERVIS